MTCGEVTGTGVAYGDIPLVREFDLERCSSGSIAEESGCVGGTYARAGKSSLWRGIPIPESLPIIGGGGAARVGPWNDTGGLGAGRLGTRPLASFV